MTRRAGSAAGPAVAAGVALLVSACSGPGRVAPGEDGAAAASGTVPGVVPPAAAGAAAAGVLTDAGVEGVRLGDDVRTAIARGLVDAASVPAEACLRHGGRRGVEGVLTDDAGRIQVIRVRATVRTGRGIGVGSTYRQVHAAYPDAEAGSAEVEAPAPQAPVPARYRFATDSGDVVYPFDVVTSVALVSERSPCPR